MSSTGCCTRQRWVVLRHITLNECWGRRGKGKGLLRWASSVPHCLFKETSKTANKKKFALIQITQIAHCTTNPVLVRQKKASQCWKSWVAQKQMYFNVVFLMLWSGGHSCPTAVPQFPRCSHIKRSAVMAAASSLHTVRWSVWRWLHNWML